MRTPFCCCIALLAALCLAGCHPQVGPMIRPADSPREPDPVAWSPPAEPLIRQVADRVLLDFPEPPTFNWGEGVLMAGMMRAGAALHEPRYIEFVRKWADYWQQRGIEPLMEERGYCGHWGPGLPVLMLYEQNPDVGYRRMTRQILVYMQRRATRTSEGFPGPSEKLRQIWVDVLFMCCPVYMHASRDFSRPELVSEAVRLLDICARHCQDPRISLFYHMYDQDKARTVGPLWGRGNGWVAMSYMEVLPHLDRDSTDYQRLNTQFQNLVKGIIATQDPGSDLWHTILDRPDTYLETSATAMFLYAFTKAQRERIVQLDPTFLPRTWSALAGKVDGQARVVGVSAGTDARDELDRYTKKPVGTFTWGTGAFLLAASELTAFPHP